MNSLRQIAAFFHQHTWAWQLVYGLLSLWAYFHYFHVITQPDTFSYLLISEDFLHGRFWEGVNSYWGMLIAVLMLPFLAIGLKGLVAFKITQIIIGGLALQLFLRLLKRVSLSPMQELAAIIPILPLLILAALILTPDLLLLTTGLWYLLLVSGWEFAFAHPLPLKGNPPAETKGGRAFSLGNKKALRGLALACKCGFAGGLMYWSKSYGLPFFIAHFSLLCLGILTLKWLKPQLPFISARLILKKYAVGMLVFILMSGLWAGAISYKTGELTFSTSGKYNIALMGNVMNRVHLTKDSLLNPETPYTKYWAYHEAGLFVEPWKPFASQENTKHFVNNIRQNISSLFYVAFIRDVLILLVIGLLGLGWVRFTRKNTAFAKQTRASFIPRQRNAYWIIVFVLAILIYTSGYLLVFIRPRYMWLIYILLWLIFWIIIKSLYQQTSWKTVRVWMVLTGLIMFINTVDRLNRMTSDRQFFQQVSLINEQLEQLPLQGKRVAANHPSGNLISLDADIYLLYEHRFKYWGQLSDKRLEAEGLKAPYQHGIDYFFCWDNPDFEQELFKKHRLVFQDTISQLNVYQLK